MSLRDLSRAVWTLAATVVLIYVLTLAIFPGVLAEDVSNSSLGSWRARQARYPQRSHNSAARLGMACWSLSDEGQLEGCEHSALSLPCPPLGALSLCLESEHLGM